VGQWLRRRDGQEGASAVEFAVVLPILLLFVFGIIEFGLAFHRLQAFQAASREAGRLLSVGVTEDVAEARALAIVSGTVAEGDVTVDLIQTCDDVGADGVRTVRVAVYLADTGSYAIQLPFTPALAEPDFRTEALYRCEVVPEPAP
jgi:Flp pilus assembly protein TadG